MTPYEKKKLESELKSFVAKNFVRPSDCKNLEQIQFYVKELSDKIESYSSTYNYVPNFAYTLLSDYNLAQNKILALDFSLAYNP